MKRSRLVTILLIIIVILAAVVGAVAYRRGGLLSAGVVKDSGSGISDYSAVFLTNGQVYFGKIVRNGGDTSPLDLEDIFYLQVNQQIQPDQKSTPTPSASGSPDIVLVKLGEELHGPNDRMLINRQQILFTESLKDDSKVVKAIGDYKAGKK